MATKNAAAVTAPEGFTQEGTPEIDGWFKADKGAVVTGQIVGLINIKNSDGQPRDVLLVKLSAPTKGVESGNDTVIEYEKGKVLGVGITASIREALLYVDSKALCWLHFIDKKKLPAGRTMWRVDQRYKGRKSALAAVAVNRAQSTNDGGDDADIPF